MSTVRRKSTDNQSDRGHTQWGTVLSTVDTEGAGNQPGSGQAGHKGHRKPDRQGAHTGEVNCTYGEHRQPETEPAFVLMQ